MHGIHVETAGDAGLLVVFSHGWGDTSATWAPQVAALRDRARCVTWDLLGHGQSDGPDDPSAYSHERAIADLEALVGAGPAVLVGHSFGGQLSISFTLQHPERVSALALLSTGPGYRDPAGRAEWNERIEKQAQACEGRGERAAAHSIRGFVTQHDSSIIDGIATITAPTLVVCGAKDRGFLNAADYFEKKLPNATKVIVPEAGHAVNRHQPDIVNAALADLLAATDFR